MDSLNPYIGTSGWNYDHWRGRFYPEDQSQQDWLTYYQQTFPTVEINNTFYNLPEADTIVSWAEQTPQGFVFAVKASRYITHMKKLKDPHQPVSNFLARVEKLGAKLGPVLFQLPPRWRCNTDRLSRFLNVLPAQHRYVFEFRDESWWNREVTELLTDHQAAFCIFELAGHQSPKWVTTDFVYIRLHGPDAAYQGTLSGWAGAITGWRRQGRTVYCYFDNDQVAYAPKNAAALKKMVSS